MTMTDARGAVYLRVSVLAIAAAAIVGPTLVVTNPPALPHPARAAMPTAIITTSRAATT